MLVATVLSQADAGRSLDTRVPVARPICCPTPVPAATGKDMTVRDLCRATLITSDNTAANLLLEVVGGPPAVTAFLRGSGDAVSRSDRNEPDVNSFAKETRATPPRAGGDGRQPAWLAGQWLQPASRQQLADWLIDNETGDACLRAGWASAGGWATRPAAMVMTRATTSPCWPRAGGAPWVLTAYLQGRDQRRAARSVLARVGRLADAMIG
jgi:beta-lactamase class A